MEKARLLNDLTAGDAAIVTGLTALGEMRRRLCDIGLIEGTRIECVRRSPLGDPVAYLIRGAVIALRREDAALVEIAGESGASFNDNRYCVEKENAG